MSFDKSKFKIFGNITTKQLYIVSQEESFELGEYFILENKNESTPLEVIETFEVPMCISGMLPIDVPNEYLKFLELDILKSANFARVKILNHIQKPIHSGEVRRASFEELEKLLINHDNINESFVLGTIQGTSSVYDLMPEKYKGIAPIFNGKEMVKQDGVPFLVNPSKQMEYPHSGYFGGSGSGKSYALKVSCEELMKRRIPAILLDPHHEMEFKDNLSEKGIDYKNRNEVFVIGTDIGIKFTELTSAELIRLCDFSDPLSEPQKATFEAIYEKGMTASTLTSRINSLREIVEMHENSTINQFDDYKKDLDVETILLYEKVKQKVSSSKAIQALSWKINKLLNSSIFSDSGTKKIESCILQSKLAIIRGDIKRMQMISSYVINKLYQKRRMYQDSITKNQGENIPYFPMFYIIMDEAHNFAPNNNDAGMNPTKQILKTVAQEARKYGVFLVMCTQRIGLLDTTIVAQMNSKYVFRTTNAQDMETIRRECNLTEEELSLLPDLPSGYCVATSPVLSKNFQIRFRACFTKTPHSFNCFEELYNYNKNNLDGNLSKLEDILIGYISTTGKVNQKHYITMTALASKALGKEVTKEELLSILDNLYSIGKIIKKPTPLGVEYLPLTNR